MFSAEPLLVWQPMGAGRTRVAKGSQGGFLVYIVKMRRDFFSRKNNQLLRNVLRECFHSYNEL